MATNFNNLVLDPEDERRLENKNLVESSRSNRRRLDRSMMFSEDSVDSANSADSGVDNKIEIPTELESFETLLWIGYTPEAAQERWEKWQQAREEYGDDFPYSFIYMAIAPTENCTMDIETADWTNGFNEIGISLELTSAIMDPRWKHIRDTESAQFWLQDTMQGRYSDLEAIQRASKKRADTSNRRQELGSSSSHPEIQPPKDTSKTKVYSSTSAATPTATAIVKPYRDVPPDHKQLWKAVFTGRIEYDSSGKIDVHSLRSTTPSDFCGKSSRNLYFAQEYEIAMEYAGYIQRRATHNTAAMLQMFVPIDLLENLGQYNLGGDEWKKVIFLSRRGKDLDEEDLALDHLFKQKLLIGHITKSTNRTYQHLASWTYISNDNKMEIPPRGSHNYGTQFVFLGKGAIRRVQQKALIERYIL